MTETITILSTSIVRPSSPTPPQHMFLPAPDFCWRWLHYNQRILFFKLDKQSADSFISHLKSSLSLAVVEFFPWAGRCFEQENGRLALDCNDAGVPFIEAYVDVPFPSLENNGFQYQPFFKHLAPHGDVTRWTGPDLPLLSVQVTRFPRDEGFVLGIGHSHIVADGSSLWHFMKSWGECARGVPLSMHPVHMREVFAPEKLILPPPCSEEENDKGGPPPHPPPGGGPGGKIELVQRNFHFTSEMVRKLKNMATTSCPADHAPFSSLQALSAHMWKHVIAAIDMDESEKSIFFLLANMRSRVEPPLPEGYFGNAVMREGSEARKGELQQESLGATALCLQRLIQTMDETLMRTFYGAVEVLPVNKIFEGKEFSMVQLQLSSSPRFLVYDVDFGWGPPLSVQCPRIRGDGEMMWFPGREGGGSIDISLALTKSAMERLEQDESFLSF
ncbi:hypothetical protein GOP47_0022758 [Adiantum capillus-veneris]|uniref:Uncharacterized protein n=1 Tax=Adiantum capillus-veneris TaxID=13818 RepID=A0A9D4U7Y6_ADICA|nr:hypothetical protein GOP47_0022758 [Adiantum capillus-veneris]